MEAQTLRAGDSDRLELRQTICNVSATSGSVCLVGTNSNVTIRNNQPGNIEEKIESCRKSLYVGHPDLDREALVGTKGRRADGTCQWILLDPQYQSWLASEFPVLRISGGPGKGKTMLSLFLTEQLTTLCRATRDRLLFFYCRFQDDRYNDSRKVLRSLAYQVLEFSHDGPQVDEVLKFFESEEMTKDLLSSFEGLWKILETLLAQPGLPTIWCIVDGIDECRASETLVGKLYDYCRGCEQRDYRSKFQLLILGRDIDGPSTTHVINLDTDHKEPVKRDVETFIRSSLEPLESISRFKKFQSEVTNTLVRKSEGTFLWVSFVIAELSGKKTYLEISNTVTSFPQGLNPTFARMLQGIDPEYRQASACILKWVIFAKRPLTLNELAAATAVTAPGRHSRADAEVTEDIVQLLRPFLSVHENIVFLVHQSAKEYLMKIDQGSESPLEGNRFIFDECHGIIAYRCLEMLKEIHYQGTHHSSRFPLFGYARKYWHYHTRLSATCPADINRPFFEKMVLEKKNIFLTTRDINYPTLHQASKLGIIRWLEALHRHERRHWKENINLRCYDETPLTLAITRAGDTNTIRFLLEHGADSQASMREAFVEATERGQSATVQLLLECGITHHCSTQEKVRNWLWSALLPSDFFEDHTGRKRSPLHRFCSDRFHTWPTNHNLYGSTLLNFAAKHGSKEIVQLVLDHGADIEATGGLGDHNALFTTALEGNLEVLKLLIRYGANIEAEDRQGRTALSAASSEGHLNIVKFLLKRGAKIEATDHDGATPLIHATEGRSSEVVRYLLDQGADVNARDGSNDTALIRAISSGDEEVFDSLLDRDVDTSVVVQSNLPLVAIATKHGSERILSFILEKGADINGKASTGATPLVNALVRCRTESRFLSLLSWEQERSLSGDYSLWCPEETQGMDQRKNRGFFLDLGRGFNDPTPNRSPAEQEQTVKFLLNHGADMNMCGRICLYEPLLKEEAEEWNLRGSRAEKTGVVVLDASPLICAASLGLDWAINLLVERGVDRDARATEWYLSKRKRDYLMRPAFKRLQEPFEDADAFQNESGERIPSRPSPEHVSTREAGSALLYASLGGHLSSVRLLLGLGADASIEDGFGMTALMWARKKGFVGIVELLNEHDEGST